MSTFDRTAQYSFLRDKEPGAAFGGPGNRWKELVMHATALRFGDFKLFMRFRHVIAIPSCHRDFALPSCLHRLAGRQEPRLTRDGGRRYAMLAAKESRVLVFAGVSIVMELIEVHMHLSMGAKPGNPSCVGDLGTVEVE